jgi:purine-nucleoside phosphorylase
VNARRTATSRSGGTASVRQARSIAPLDARTPVAEQRRRIESAATFLAKRFKRGFRPKVGIILGTGLGAVAEAIEDRRSIPYASIPGFPVSTVKGHKGEMLAGTLRGCPVLAMEGRFHHYEGYTLQEVAFPVRVLRALGCDTLLVTNACGGLDPLFRSGDLMLIDDHINLMGDSPLRGPNDDDAGPRFPDLCRVYDAGLIALAEKVALESGITLRKGVYAALPGPQLETRAEYRMLRVLGAHVVGMSSVPEALAAVHGGMKVMGLSVVTDMCLPDHLEPVDIDRILATAASAGPSLSKLLLGVVASI